VLTGNPVLKQGNNNMSIIMRTQAVCLLLALFLSSGGGGGGVEAWMTLPTPRAIAVEVAKGCATAATCAVLLTSPPVFAQEALVVPAAGDDLTTTTTTTATTPTTVAPVPATMPSSSIKVDINARYLFDLIKTEDARAKTLDRVTFLADSIKNLFGPGVSVELPTDIKGFVRQALAGGAAIKVNGQDVAVKVIESSSGEIAFQIYNKYIPALPFVGLKNTPSYVGAAASVIENAAPNVVDAVTAAMMNSENAEEQQGPFWESLTPVEVIGGGSLALGVAYGASYSFYQYEQFQEEQEAIQKQTQNKAKAAAAAAKKKTSDKVKDKDGKKSKEGDVEATKQKQEALVLAAETAAAAAASSVGGVKTQDPESKRQGLKSRVKSLFRSGEK
jgi:hypothetical protein